MAELKEARVPDIGDYDGVPVIEVLVAVGDTVAKDQGLVTLESDKATMEVPAPFGGVVKELRIKVGDSVKEGSVVAMIEATDAASLLPPGEEPAPSEGGGARRADAPKEVPLGDEGVAAGNDTTTGKPAPSPAAAQRPLPEGEVKTSDDSKVEPVAVAAKPDNIAQASIDAQTGKANASAPMGAGLPPVRFDAEALLPGKVPYASPAVRLFARELGVDLVHVTGSARGGRISKDDVQGFVKGAIAGGNVVGNGAPAGGLNIIPWPKVDFAKFGDVESKPLSRIKKLSGANLHRNWVSIPHVTNHEDADITELEALRVQLNKEAEGKSGKSTGTKVTMLAFLVKACASALQKLPNFNASLDGDNLILKKYFHIGFAADTPNGLMVPVIRDADHKGVIEIAKEMGELAALARDGKLKPDQMQGGCFSISSLGGIGGTYFTPIINAPEVAILGVCRSSTRPVWDGKQFAPRLILPLSLSWDHRVIDGAEAARFNAYLAQVLADFRRVLL